MGQGFDVFISYASADREYAQAVHDQLKAAGLSVWFDQARLKPGLDWHREIEAGCEASRVMLPILTPRWGDSRWTCYETYVHNAIVPLLFEGTVEESFTPPLRRFQAQSIDFRTVEQDDWDRLIELVRERVKQIKANPPVRPDRTATTGFPPNPHFQGREDTLNAMIDALFRSPTTAVTQGRAEVVASLGGIGKTTLANEFVHRYWRLYQHVFWVDCRRDITTQFADIARQLWPDQKLGTDLTTLALAAAKELHRPLPAGAPLRLLVLDNAEGPDELKYEITLPQPNGTMLIEEGSWLPTCGSCHTILTSRFAKWPGNVEMITLDVLDRRPSRDLLAERAGKPYVHLDRDERRACMTLIRALGYFPLALEAAGAYIANEGPGFGMADYLAFYQRSQARTLREHAEGFTDYPASVYTTWRVTIEKLSPEARALLRLCAWLAATPIPLAMFSAQGKGLAAAGALLTGETPTKEAPDEDDVRGYKTELVNYSMAKAVGLGDLGQGFTIHNLTQAVERHKTPEEQADEWFKSTVNIFQVFAPAVLNNPAGWPVWRLIEPHALQLAEHAGDQAGSDVQGELTTDVANYAFTQARYSEAEPLMRRALSIDEASYGKDHPNVARDLNNLAQLLKATNRLGEAEPLMRRALAIDEASYGEDHPEVAIDLNNLASLLQATNRLDEAEPLMQRALAIDEASYGEDHPNVAIRLNNLALLLKATNRLDEAEPLMRRALAIDETSYGKDHPNVAIRLNNLAQLLQDTNRLSEAEPLMRRALAIDETSYGKEHPEVATDLNNLAQLLQATNRLGEAEPLMRRMVGIFMNFTRSTGHQHPHLLAGVNNYGVLLMEMGHTQEQAIAEIRVICPGLFADS
ncbi:MAG: tetratricopeptide repeat protein [Planctomycetota bacterium]